MIDNTVIILINIGVTTANLCLLFIIERRVSYLNKIRNIEAVLPPPPPIPTPQPVESEQPIIEAVPLVEDPKPKAEKPKPKELTPKAKKQISLLEEEIGRLRSL